MPNIPLDAELAAKIAAAGYEAVAVRPPKEGEWYWSPIVMRPVKSSLNFPACQIFLILSPLVPEQPKAEEWRPGVGEHRTRGGFEAVVDTDQGNDPDYPLLGRTRKNGRACWDQECWTRDGIAHLGRQDAMDLVPPAPAAPEVVSEEPLLEGWVNQYRDSVGPGFHRTKHLADIAATSNGRGFVRCVHFREVREVPS